MKDIKFRDLKASEIECRVGTVKEGKGFSLLLYKTARADMQILDQTFGVYNWSNRYYQVKNTMLCAISIWDDERKEWVEKCDGGDDDFNAEKIKGECSDAFKRASFRIGIGRKLYESPFIWINESTDNNKYAKYEVSEIGYDETSVNKLVIINTKTKQVVFSYGVGSKQAPKEPKPLEKTNLDNKGSVSMKEISASVADMGDFNNEKVITPLDNEDTVFIKNYFNKLEEDRKEKFGVWMFTIVKETNIDRLDDYKASIVASALKKQVAKELERKASDR